MRISDWSSDVCSSDLVGGLHIFENGQRARAQMAHLLLADRSVAQRRTPVGRTLENEELFGGLRRNGDDLDARRPRAYHPDALAREVIARRLPLFVRGPVRRVVGLSLEIIDSLAIGRPGGRAGARSA